MGDLKLTTRTVPGNNTPCDLITIAADPPEPRMQSLTNLPVRTYQDLVLDDQTVVAGQRDCLGRWKILEPYLPRSGTVLDIGSNMGWFGWMISRRFPECVVASVEPDERSAALQRQMLRSHESQRTCLLTSRANARMARVLAQAGQQLDAVLCLSVLHWLPEHRQMLSTLGRISRRILVEQPDPRESGAGFERIRCEIGPIGPYLESLYPGRPLRRLAQLASHRGCPFPREIWLVDSPSGDDGPASAGLDVAALLSLSPSWPRRQWWLEQYDERIAGKTTRGRAVFTARGLEVHESSQASPFSGGLRRGLARLPEERLLSRRDWCRRRIRRWGGAVLRGLRILRAP